MVTWRMSVGQKIENAAALTTTYGLRQRHLRCFTNVRFRRNWSFGYAMPIGSFIPHFAIPPTTQSHAEHGTAADAAFDI